MSAALRRLAAASALVLTTACHRHAPSSARSLTSVVVHAEEGTTNREAWGEWRRRLSGATHATKDIAVALYTLAPGQAPHPPHKHAEEELMILVTGEGTWNLGGKESPAHEGDLLYAATWDLHGLRNTSPLPLRYYVVKWLPP